MMIFLRLMIAIFFVAAIATISSASYAGTNPYSDCGIGEAVFRKTSWAAVTSNVTWDLGTTAMTSASSSPKTCTSHVMEGALFINSSYETLAEETAAGRGEHLSTVLNIFQCDIAHHSAAAQQIRSAMGLAVAMPNYILQTHIEKATDFYAIVENAVKNSCTA